jgi:hypothetical protein
MRYKVTVVLIARPTGEEETKPFEPGADFALAVMDTLIVVGRCENQPLRAGVRLEKLKANFSAPILKTGSGTLLI